MAAQSENERNKALVDENVVAEDGQFVAVFNIGVTRTDAVVKIVDHWEARS
jgi:hypothetical protein